MLEKPDISYKYWMILMVSDWPCDCVLSDAGAWSHTAWETHPGRSARSRAPWQPTADLAASVSVTPTARAPTSAGRDTQSGTNETFFIAVSTCTANASGIHTCENSHNTNTSQAARLTYRLNPSLFTCGNKFRVIKALKLQLEILFRSHRVFYLHCRSQVWEIGRHGDPSCLRRRLCRDAVQTQAGSRHGQD